MIIVQMFIFKVFFLLFKFLFYFLSTGIEIIVFLSYAPFLINRITKNGNREQFNAKTQKLRFDSTQKNGFDFHHFLKRILFEKQMMTFTTKSVFGPTGYINCSHYLSGATHYHLFGFRIILVNYI